MTAAGLDGPPVHRITLLVPSSWYEFDIHPATRDQAIRDAVGARVRERPELAKCRSELVRTLRRVADEAWESGVVYFGAMAEVDDEAPLTASLTVTVLDTADEGAPQGGLEGVMAALAPLPRGSRPTDPWRRVRLVDLPDAGTTAARSEGIEDVVIRGDTRTVRMVMMQTFVPFPGTDPRIAVISAATHQLALAEPMLELFDGICETFRFLP
ncbi:hypothetical protein [Streptomyces sp. NPDC020917]|uniref:hypothetical protein n=1 Tax=Streptomyces sp. NPDC020917 TaxID=3365102 RepID=UPI0037AC14DE